MVDRFGGLVVAATEEYCEKRAPVLEQFIISETAIQLDNWESNEVEGWYSLIIKFKFKVKPDRFNGDWVKADVDVKLTCYSCLRLKPTLTKAIDSPIELKIEKD